MFGGFPFGGMPGGGMPGGFPGMDSGPAGPVNNSKYYEALGVGKDASDADIKKAYRKMAAKHHPDKGGDPDFFKTINEAYDVLKDPKKKQIYDTHGEEVLKEGGGGGAGGGGGMSDLFDMLNGGRGGRRAGPRKADDTVHKLSVPLKDFYMGTTKRMALRRPVKCDTCAGTGSKSQSMTNCTRCRGSGVETQIRQIGPGMMTQVQGRCSGCSGRGKSIKPGDQCGQCRGGGVRDEQKRFDVELDKGAPDGHKVTFRGESGTDDSSKEPGDLIFVFSEAKNDDADWQRQGNDLLLMDYAISLKQALCGHEIHLRHLDGRVIKLQRDAGDAIKPGDFVRVPDEGMPLMGRPFSKGNLYVRFSVNMPKALSAQTVAQLEALLPDDGGSALMDSDDAEEVRQSAVGGIERLREELQSRMRQYRQQQSSAYDSDEDEGAGGQRVQCAQQ